MAGTSSRHALEQSSGQKRYSCAKNLVGMATR